MQVNLRTDQQKDEKAERPEKSLTSNKRKIQRKLVNNKPSMPSKIYP